MVWWNHECDGNAAFAQTLNDAIPALHDIGRERGSIGVRFLDRLMMSRRHPAWRKDMRPVWMRNGITRCRSAVACRQLDDLEGRIGTSPYRGETCRHVVEAHRLGHGADLDVCDIRQSRNKSGRIQHF